MFKADYTIGGSGKTKGMFFGGPGLNRKPINSVQVAECTVLSETHPILKRVLSLLLEWTMGNGLQFEFKEFNVVRTPSNEMKSIIQTEWQDFAKAFIRSAIVYGMVLWKIVPSRKHPGKYIPIVLPFNAHRIEFFYVDYVRQWEVYLVDQFYKTSNGQANIVTEIQPDIQVSVIDEPTLEGNLTSSVAVVLNSVYCMIEKQSNHIDADYIATHPQVVVARGIRNGTVGSDKGTTIACDIVAPGDFQSQLNERKTVMDEALKESFDNAQALALAHRRPGMLKVNETTRQTETSDRYNMFDNRVDLPVNTTIVAPPSVHVPPDYSSTINMYLHIIATTFNIPATMLTMDSSTHAADEHMAFSMLNPTIKTLHRSIIPYMKEAYLRINGRKHLYEMNEKIEKTNEAGKPLTDNEIAVIYDNVSISAYFLCSPLMSLETLNTLLDKEAISHETYARRAIDISGLDESDILPERKRLSERHFGAILDKISNPEPKPTTSSSSSAKEKEKKPTTSSSSSKEKEKKPATPSSSSKEKKPDSNKKQRQK